MGIVLIVGAASLAWVYGGRTQIPADVRARRMMANQPTPVRVTTAQQSNVDVHLRALGTVTPLNTVTVRSRLDGELVRVLFTEGQRVQAGQLLAEIDARPYQVALEEAEGTQQENSARLKNAQVDLQTYEKLFGELLITKQQVTSQEALVRQFQGVAATNEAQVNNARLQLSYTKILAPIEGRLGLRQVDAGNLIRSGDANGLVVITQMRPISVIFTVPESDLPGVLKVFRAGQRLQVEAWDRAESQKLAEGTLQTVDNQIDTATGSIKLRALFENGEELLFPNQFVNIRLRVSTLPNATVIPSAAVQRASFGPFVYVVQDNSTVTIRKITPGPAEGDRTAVTAGLSPKERVVLEGVDELSEGAKVEVIPEAGAAPTAAPAQNGQGGRRGGRSGPGGPGSGPRS